MAFDGLEDALRPTDGTYKAFYERGYRTWYKLLVSAVGDCTLPSACLEWENLYPQHPILPDDVDPDASGLVVAKSTWISSEGHCDIPAFEQTFRLVVTTWKPTSIILENNVDLSLHQWLGKDDGHVVVLMLAWAYALSARWTEMIPRATPMEYTTSQATWVSHSLSHEAFNNEESMLVDLGNVTGEAARWWAAVLAPEQGWKAIIPHERWSLLPPWTITKEFKNTNIVLTSSSSPLNCHSSIPASFKTALKHIEDYTRFHGADTQNRAALAAALLLPQARFDNRNVRLHAPRGLCRRLSKSTKQLPKISLLEEPCLRQLDKLMTLSANVHGTKTVLGSIFYETGIPANACGAWSQGTMAVLKSKAAGNLHLLAHMFFHRSPHISFLWLGGIITGADEVFLRVSYALYGVSKIDLHEAAWTDTLISFIQEPVSTVPDNTASISRADECRLMFLTQDPQGYPPINSYPPLGCTDIKDTTLGVQLHAHCPGSHGLRFLSITWPCVRANKGIQTTGPIYVLPKDHITNNLQEEDEAIEVDYSWLDREKEPSDCITRNMFCWMRDMDGYTVAERDIYRHEWIDAFDSSDDESLHPEGDGASTRGVDIDARLGSWVASTVTRRCNSL
ncbi:hypothetical protein NM208_g4031 [Fusarium decemcellulare]|uniref:Uncharacterized protein n=2 Tax=Fusarium decemcellulare TaxID=57161 RepID=A0ACC1SLC6_9HYPO|nr:hypothetical protein NM208_g4280 [Fusarium decemcellulare]KAJ3542558.1 hypothetical protein NM208_g4031 [Fusarium decemcellulare]